MRVILQFAGVTVTLIALMACNAETLDPKSVRVANRDSFLGQWRSVKGNYRLNLRVDSNLLVSVEGFDQNYRYRRIDDDTIEFDERTVTDQDVTVKISVRNDHLNLVCSSSVGPPTVILNPPRICFFRDFERVK